MRRTILLGTLVIGAALAIVFGSTFAAFTDETVTSGTVQAATIDITANNIATDGTTDAPISYDYTLPDVGGLLPGEAATATITIRNVGTRAVHVVATPTVTSSDEANCPATNLDVSYTLTDTGSDDHGSPVVVHIDETTPNNSEVYNITATLSSSADNGCQGVTFTVVYDFVATGVPDAS